MNYILFDSEHRNKLLPFTYTRPVCEIRIGILTIREKWEKHLGFTTTTLTEEYLQKKYPMVELKHNIMINASFLPTEKIANQIKNLKENEAIFKDGELVAFYTTNTQNKVDFDQYTIYELTDHFLQIKNTWDIFSLNAIAIQADFELLTKDAESQKIPDNVNYTNKKNIFIEKGATIHFCSLNASNGPIYIGKNTEIMEGTLIRGPFALCNNSTTKMGSKIYGATTIGPHCKVGGEVNNSVFFGFANKAHDGFLGNSVIGEWCNLGADSNNSNLKNNYAEVKLWNYPKERFIKTGLQFCGLMLGDHSKCGINTMFNTGTVVGISANIYGGNFPRNFIPSFAWGGNAGFKEYNLNKAKEVAKIVMQRRKVDFNEVEDKIFETVFEITTKYRNFQSN
jgi:UDP-N-acetylglucosamine diphosphorylase/glucosamine-1-phosphate N-acetyltransferase